MRERERECLCVCVCVEGAGEKERGGEGVGVGWGGGGGGACKSPWSKNALVIDGGPHILARSRPPDGSMPTVQPIVSTVV